MYLQILSILVLAALVECVNSGEMTAKQSNNSKRKLPKKVRLDVYYEALCPDSIKLYITELVPVMKELGAHIDLKTYPAGKVTIHEQDGVITFKCQHGEKECYGNKLHACAIDMMQSTASSWLDFNACLLSARSDDAAADACAKKVNTNSEPIKTCAKGIRGTKLLRYYTDISSLVSYKYIPHVRIDGDAMPHRADLRKAVYDAIENLN